MSLTISSKLAYPTISSSELTVSQQRIWTGQKLSPSEPLYNMAMAFHIAGRLNPELFNAAFREVVKQSDALRAVFTDHDGVPVQHILKELNYEIKLIDLSTSSNSPQLAQSLLRTRAAQPFKLEKRLFESILLKESDDSYVWFLNQHHLICDAWSCALLYERVAHYYQCALENQPDEILPPLNFATTRLLRIIPENPSKVVSLSAIGRIRLRNHFLNLNYMDVGQL